MNKQFYRLGIIGNPLSHSISPAIQNAALKSIGTDGSYEKFEITAENLPEQIDFFKKNDFSGFNITIPHKVEVLKYLDGIDETAKKIGAVNTVKITDDKKLIGYNTDIFGFKNSLPQKNFNKAMLFGCGGAALAVVFALELTNCKELTICARNINKANDFIKSIENKISIKLSKQKIVSMQNIPNTDLIINATPLGTKGANENLSILSKELLSTASQDAIIYDLVYNPQETKLLKTARELNLKTINGLEMLILQGAKAFEIWTEQTPNIQLMKTAAIDELKNY